ncbi:MAG: (E)-4-hydroxy-3-methylbut-2-enyl-diphosphate synthase [Bacteroidales bacterium]
MRLRYCIDLANYERFPSRIVMVGDVPVGGAHPIRLQSMTNTDTRDVKNTIEQAKRIFDAGGDFVRITTQGMKEVKSLKEIKTTLHRDGYTRPLIADVHFNAKIAEAAAELVEKIRINPGNYVDSRATFTITNKSDAAYDSELQLMHERLLPLIKICKKNGTAIRIGSNYGSLSDRIMNRYGNTPEGMVEAAMEYYRIFRAESFDNLILSMKASDPKIMVEASRLLNARMIQEGVSYPQHLGVTEAGEGREGRMRSAVGIGALLADGIGDTIRVSLTEAPEKEIPVAQTLVKQFANKTPGVIRMPIYVPEYDTFEGIDKDQLPHPFSKTVVACDFRNFTKIEDKDLKALGFTFNKQENKWLAGKTSPEILLTKDTNLPEQNIDCKLLCENITPHKGWCTDSLVNAEILRKNDNPEAIECVYDDLDERQLEERLNLTKPIFILNTNTDYPTGEVRSFISRLGKFASETTVLLKIPVDSGQEMNTAAEYGAILVENRMAGFVYEATEAMLQERNNFIFDMLQAAGIRRSKVEFISCPGCGRTLFDLENTTSQIKKEFGHLDDLKIAVMGCIVNGPGEMLDADYGYIGAGKGKVSLYKGQKPIMKNIPEEQAVEALKNLLKKNKDWKEPEL